MSRPSPYAPGWDGYLVAVVVAVATMGALISFRVLLEAGIGQALAAGFVSLLYIPPFALPAALVGVPLVHLACRNAPAQWRHVAAAACAGFVPGAVGQALLGSTLDGTLFGWLPGEVALSAAVGRLAVVPFVPAARARRQPVDDDFAGTPPRW